MSLDKVRQNNIELEQLLKNGNISDKTINLIQESKVLIIFNYFRKMFCYLMHYNNYQNQLINKNYLKLDNLVN